MKIIKTLLLIALVLLVPANSIAKDKKKKKNDSQQNLPKVLVIGDISYSKFARTAASQVKNQIKLVFDSQKMAYHSGSALEDIDKILDKQKWDLIHFNFGINDIMYKAPGINTVRALHKDVGGVQVTSPEQYEKNLHQLVKKFKATGAKVIWASTMPIKSSTGVVISSDIIKYNKVAAKVMKDNKVTVNDMHSYVSTGNKGKSKAKKPKGKSKVDLHTPMIQSILKELGIK